MMGLFSGNSEVVNFLVSEVNKLTVRIEKLENETKYIADQPKGIPGSLFTWEMARNAYNNGINLNEVPITDVVKAIVKHLGMEIEKVAEHTVNNPMEVKVVEKVTVLNTNGVTGTTGTTWANVAPIPTPKRKYTKRKTK